MTQKYQYIILNIQRIFNWIIYNTTNFFVKKRILNFLGKIDATRYTTFTGLLGKEKKEKRTCIRSALAYHTMNQI